MENCQKGSWKRKGKSDQILNYRNCKLTTSGWHEFDQRTNFNKFTTSLNSVHTIRNMFGDIMAPRYAGTIRPKNVKLIFATPVHVYLLRKVFWDHLPIYQ